MQRFQMKSGEEEEETVDHCLREKNSNKRKHKGSSKRRANDQQEIRSPTNLKYFAAILQIPRKISAYILLENLNQIKAKRSLWKIIYFVAKR